MIVYKNTAKGFLKDNGSNMIADVIETYYSESVGRRVSPNEKRSWANSMMYMSNIVREAEVDESTGILIEYILPGSSARIDFIIAGEDEHANKNFIIIELKQWEQAQASDKEDLVETYLGGGVRLTTHPSYQSSSYKLYLRDYNESVYNGNINPYSCAYLHNYVEADPEPLLSEIYANSIRQSPIFFKRDGKKLQDFIKQHVGNGNGECILYEIEKGKIRPSKKLVDHISKMFKGNKEFVLLDDQKIAYETALYLGIQEKDHKSVLLVKGGPGTGKSVISMNLVNGFLGKKKNVVFVAPNASFRDVMVKKLAKDFSAMRIKHLFKGSSSFVEVPENTYDVIIVDEAHRLKDGTAYMYKGENQVEDLVKAGKTVVFFVDDNQIIRPDDIGSTAEIKRVAGYYDAEVQELQLTAQFRCSGAEGYLNWLDDVLHIKQTANFDGWDKESFEFKIFDDPNDMAKAIKAKQNLGFNSRLLAGYAWKWSSAKDGNADGEVEDIEISKYNFKMPWNSRKTGTTWAIDSNGIDEVGCIHTAQGLEFDYVGVIVGNEFRFNTEELEYFVNWESYKDSNGKKGLKNQPDKLVRLVKNIYKTLMSRGMKGCFVYFMDKEVREYFESRMSNLLTVSK